MALLAIGELVAQWGYGRARRAEQYLMQRRTENIARVQELCGNQKWLDSQLEQLRASGEWLTDNFMLMRDGDWLVYENRCSKQDRGAPSSYDIFVGKGSDDKWYCSTWHFCIGVLNLRMEGQPGSLRAFQMAYYAEPFDGAPNNCPKKTWRRDGEFEIRGGSTDSDGNMTNEVFRAKVTDKIWERVSILVYGRIYELTDKQLEQLQGFAPRSYSGSGGGAQWYSFVRTVTTDGIEAQQEVRIVVRPDSGVTIERR